MKQFCGLGKEEHLSSWSNSECPLTLIYHVVCDFWKSEALENNQIWKISPLLLSFLLCGNKLSGTRVNIVCFSFKKIKNTEVLTTIMLSYLVLSVWSKLCLWWISIPAEAMTLTLETRGSLVAGHPGFPGMRRAGKSIFWTSHRNTLAFPIINFVQATNPAL